MRVSNWSNFHFWVNYPREAGIVITIKLWLIVQPYNSVLTLLVPSTKHLLAFLCFNRCRFRSDIRRDLELPPFHPRRRAGGDRAAQCQPSGVGEFSGRGEDRSGDALGVVVLRRCWAARGPHYFALHFSFSSILAKDLTASPQHTHSLHPLWLFFIADGWINHPPACFQCVYIIHIHFLLTLETNFHSH